jgi:hypothetical protein
MDCSDEPDFAKCQKVAADRELSDENNNDVSMA